MPKLHDAAARQSRTLQTLASIEPEGITALAAAGLVLCHCLNDARLVINPELSPDLAAVTDDLIDGLYTLQDAVFGSADRIPAALVALLAIADREVDGATETLRVMSGAAKGGAQ